MIFGNYRIFSQIQVAGGWSPLWLAVGGWKQGWGLVTVGYELVASAWRRVTGDRRLRSRWELVAAGCRWLAAGGLQGAGWQGLGWIGFGRIGADLHWIGFV